LFKKVFPAMRSFTTRCIFAVMGTCGSLRSRFKWRLQNTWHRLPACEDGNTGWKPMPRLFRFTIRHSAADDMSNFNIPMAIGIGGFVGALLRFYISAVVIRFSGDDYRFLGTLTVNLVGCLAIGVLMTVAAKTTFVSPVMQKFLITGLLGSLTTFSTFAFESLDLIQDGRYGAAMMKISVSLIVGLLLVWLGMLLAGVFVAAENDPV